MMVEPSRIISALIRELVFAVWSPPCEDTMWKQPFIIQEAGLLQTLDLPASWPWISLPPKVWDINFCRLSHLIYSKLLYLPKKQSKNTKKVSEYWLQKCIRKQCGVMTIFYYVCCGGFLTHTYICKSH